MSVGNSEIMIALYDYTANDPEELSIRKNEQLVLLDSTSSWWKVRNESGRLGLVPSNYLRRDKSKESFVNRIANKFPVGKSRKTGGAGGAAAGGGGGRQVGGAMDLPGNQFSTPAQCNEEYVSKFNYDATKEDELSLTKGMRVLVIQMEEDGWWYGKDADRPGNPGWFPSNYVTKQENNPPSSTPPLNAPLLSSSQPVNNDCTMVVRTLYPFNPTNPEELAFEQDEYLDIIDQPSNDPEWWLGRNSEGTTGLVPQNYVEAVPDAPSVFQQNHTSVPSTNGIAVPSFNNEFQSQPDNNQFSDKDWFFGPIKRTEAEEILNVRAENGQFLVRNSETSTEGFSISMRMPGRMRHFKVNELPDGKFGIGQRQFESLDALLDHYKRAPIYTSKEQGKVYLTNPVPR